MFNILANTTHHYYRSCDVAAYRGIDVKVVLISVSNTKREFMMNIEFES